jgi:hypothetical protein
VHHRSRVDLADETADTIAKFKQAKSTRPFFEQSYGYAVWD